MKPNKIKPWSLSLLLLKRLENKKLQLYYSFLKIPYKKIYENNLKAFKIVFENPLFGLI